jgi:predicted aspartyl protease
MNILRYSLAGFVVLLLFSIHPLWCGTSEAASGGAVIRSDAVPLYSEMSASSPVLKSLKKGDPVVVDIEIEDPEGAWCGIIEQGQTSIAGYVRCKDLERPPREQLWRQVGSTTPRGSDYGQDSSETKVTIAGNHVLVPVTLEYKGRMVGAQLVLDTGASVTMINTDIAAQLGIDPAETVPGEGQAVGGIILQAAFAKLGYINVGPHTRKDMIVSIVAENGLRERRDGLLGMDFLRGLKYYVDFKNQVISWGH